MSNGELKATASKGFRNPTIREMYLFGTKNADLKAERLMNYELAWSQRMNNGFTYGANLFYIKGSNIIISLPVSTEGKRFMNSGEIENWGVEAEAKYPIDQHFSVNANSSFLHMKNKVTAAPTSTGYLGVDYRQDKWFATLGLQYIDGLYTAVGNTETKENFWLMNAAITYVVVGNLNSPVVSLWGSGENLLAQKYKINLGYPMPRATFMGGVSVNF
jgi:iron complex outermembrane receptor protein